MKNKILNLYNLIRRLFQLSKDSVILYQMGKVGSSSIERELIKQGVDVLHIHKITSADVYFYDPRKVDAWKLFRANMLYKIISFILKWKSCKVITIVRDPMDRTLSQMFHHLDFLIYSHTKSDSRKEESANELFKSIFLNDINITYASEWMSKEFNKFMGVNCYDFPFDKKLGYGFVESGNKKALVIRFEDMSSLTSVIADFAGVQSFELGQSNRASHKWYGELYKSFKADFKVGDSTFNMMYGNNYCDHYYGASFARKKREIWVS